jgi:Domain of unknown function (DUF4253)
VSRANLPADGALELGSIRLPPGRQVPSMWKPEAVAWITDELVTNPGRTWLSLSEMAPETGLQPFLMPDASYGPEQWFVDPRDPGEIDGVDAAEILRDLWHEDVDDEWVQQERYPFGSTFPGLAARADAALARTELLRALDAFAAAPICLVAASRPADALVSSGWLPGVAFQDPAAFGAVLRSWEERFGAVVVQASPSAEIRLMVQRPPRTMSHALAVAAEHWAFCDTWIDEERGERTDLTNIRDIAGCVLEAPVWGFWWD